MMNTQFLYMPIAKRYVGCDEAGRGALAGPVVAAAVLLPQGYSSTKIKDSKQLSTKQRKKLAKVIKLEAVAWGIGVASPREIDDVNILQASFLAMHRAIDALELYPEVAHLLIDGNQFKPYRTWSHSCFIKGDQHILSIAAASILAKHHRDTLMQKLDKIYPCYEWANNKGYATQTHRRTISIYGTTPHHRASFRIRKEDSK